MKFRLTYQQKVDFECRDEKAAKILLKDFKRYDAPSVGAVGGGVEEGNYSYKSLPGIKIMSFRKIGGKK